MNLIKLLDKIDIAFITSENSKTTDTDRLKRGTNLLLYQNLACIIYEKVLKSCTKTINYQLQRGMKSLNYLMDYILYPILRYFFEYIIKIMLQ